MASFNKVILLGNLTRDPELKYTANQTPVCQIGLAVNRKWKDQNGEQREEVTFVDCEAWARTAEVINEYTHKGDPLFVEGRLKLDQWEDKDGGKRSKIKVVIENVQLLGGKRDAAPRQAPPTPQQPPRQRVPQSPQANMRYDPQPESRGEDPDGVPF